MKAIKKKLQGMAFMLEASKLEIGELPIEKIERLLNRVHEDVVDLLDMLDKKREDKRERKQQLQLQSAIASIKHL